MAMTTEAWREVMIAMPPAQLAAVKAAMETLRAWPEFNREWGWTGIKSLEVTAAYAMEHQRNGGRGWMDQTPEERRRYYDGAEWRFVDPLPAVNVDQLREQWEGEDLELLNEATKGCEGEMTCRELARRLNNVGGVITEAELEAMTGAR